MPTIVLKADPDEDLYICWSTIVDAPTWWGTRAEALTLDEVNVERLDRADRTGTSAMGGFSFFGRWDDTHLMYGQRGLLPRGRLIDACEALFREDEAAVWEMLTPFED